MTLVIPHMRPTAVLSLLILVIEGSGCRRTGPARGNVSGTVTYRGEPVEEGSIKFYDPTSGRGAQTTLGARGAYRLNTVNGGLPVGTYRITIHPSLVLEAGDGTPPIQVPKQVPDIPDKYRSEETSGLVYTVHEGQNVHDVDMR